MMLKSWSLLVSCFFLVGLVPTAQALSNPAAQHCLKLQGQIEILKDSAGEAGYCHWGRGMIEQWTLFRFQIGQQPQLAISRFLSPLDVPSSQSPRRGNPASIYCAQQGGQIVIVQDRSGAQVGICQFQDKSAIEEWTLLRGSQDPTNQALTQILQ